MSPRPNSIKLRSHEQISGAEYHKRVTRSKHLFRRADAYGIDAAQLEYFTGRGITDLYFHEQDTGKTWHIETEKFAAHAFTANLGYGNQVLCRLMHFDETAGNDLPAAEVVTAKKNDYQPTLFSLFAYGGH